jgi:hypothetical protein
MSTVVATYSNDAAAVSLTVTTVSMLIILVEAIDSSAIFNVGIEVSKSDDKKLDCSTDASTSISDK